MTLETSSISPYPVMAFLLSISPSASKSLASLNGVSITEGATTLHVMPRGLTSLANPRENSVKAAFYNLDLQKLLPIIRNFFENFTQTIFFKPIERIKLNLNQIGYLSNLRYLTKAPVRNLRQLFAISS